MCVTGKQNAVITISPTSLFLVKQALPWKRSVPPAAAGGSISVRTHPLPQVVLTLSKPVLTVSAKHAIHVARDLVGRNGTSAEQQLLIGVAERVRDLFSRVFPFVNQLFEHA